MAAFTTNTVSHRATGPSLFERLDTVFTTVARARTGARGVAHLSALSDTQLAARGLTRAQVVRPAARAYL